MADDLCPRSSTSRLAPSLPSGASATTPKLLLRRAHNLLYENGTNHALILKDEFDPHAGA
jgi:hypothetical protein